MQDHDDSDRLVAAVQAARAAGTPLTLLGSGSKRARFPDLQPSAGAALSTAEHVGVIYYAPDELVLEARAGTPLAAISEALAERGQQLAFEPPRFGAGGTLGGAIAAGLGGPARPWAGAPRDAVLGVELLNGHGEPLRFGGRVVKNVAGYDIARLQAGAFGTFGCLLSVALRVMPQPPTTVTLTMRHEAETALECLRDWSRYNLPLTGSCWSGGELMLRLAGPAAAVEQATARIRHETQAEVRDRPGFWASLRDFAHPFFQGPRETGGSAPADRLYRASLPLGTPALDADAAGLLEWRGAQRWYWLSATEVGAVAEQVRTRGGYLLPAADPGLTANRQPGVAAVADRLRSAFDPAGIFNPHLVHQPEATDAH
ncbi:MAG: glycolate oxidase subunit GlcE [Pseudomonadota bacterium]